MNESSWQLHCPIPLDEADDRVLLAHGEGARLTRRFIDEHICSRFHTPELSRLSDAAHLRVSDPRIAVTTDSFVVSPLFFPGGDIGTLAVHGTVNDLAVAGAVPRWITLSMILEEGLPMGVLAHVLDSVARAATDCSVDIIAGDTKVVPRGAADGMFLNTTGLGELVDPIPPGPQAIQAGDVILVSGPIGRHGIAVLCAREELAFDPPPESDSAPLIHTVECLRSAVGTDIRALRDATRGGVSAVLHEWSAICGLSFQLIESEIPVSAEVRGASELLGLDPLYVACEGTLVAAVSGDSAEAALTALRANSAGAAIIGVTKPSTLCPVTIQRMFGREQPLDEPTGAMLPRIC